MDKYDVFISYRRNGGDAWAHLIMAELEKKGISVFLDTEELTSGKFNEALYNSISNAKNFLVVLSKNALDRCFNKDDWVTKEIQCAINKGLNIIPVMVPEFIWPDKLPDEINDIRNYNGVIISSDYLKASIEKVIRNMKNVKCSDLEDNDSRQNEGIQIRSSNTYFGMEQSEIDRLNIQQNLVREFDREVFQRAVRTYAELTVLDVGSNVGTMIMDRIGYADNVRKIIGLEWNEEAVKKANETYEKTGKVIFYQSDVESEEFDKQLTMILKENEIEKFNVVVMSMLILHLKTPHKLLSVIKKHLDKDGMLIIRDIDDGYNIAYPDEDGSYKRIFEICSKNETSGYRFSGRQIFTQLTRAGFRNVKLEKIGLTTVGLDTDEREALYKTYFQFVKEDLAIMVDRYPDNQRYKEDYEWFYDKDDELLDKFMGPDFYFSLGFMLFTAKR